VTSYYRYLEIRLDIIWMLVAARTDSFNIFIIKKLTNYNENMYSIQWPSRKWRYKRQENTIFLYLWLQTRVCLLHWPIVLSGVIDTRELNRLFCSFESLDWVWHGASKIPWSQALNSQTVKNICRVGESIILVAPRDKGRSIFLANRRKLLVVIFYIIIIG